MRLSVELSAAQEGQLNAIAQRLNVPADALAAAALRDLLDSRDAVFAAAAAYVVEKNAELYRRLA
jgi:predicted transcriptional regulator